MERVAARYVYTLDREAPLLDGFVEYDGDGTVTAVGECADPASEPNFLDGAIVPGFVNTHCHVELSYMWKLFRKGTGMAGFIDQINELRDTKPLEEKVGDIRRWMGTMWDRGVSAMADISNCSDSFAIKKASPMYTRTFLEVFGTEPEDCGAVMEGVMRLKSEAESLGRVADSSCMLYHEPGTGDRSLCGRPEDRLPVLPFGGDTRGGGYGPFRTRSHVG